MVHLGTIPDCKPSLSCAVREKRGARAILTCNILHVTQEPSLTCNILYVTQEPSLTCKNETRNRPLFHSTQQPPTPRMLSMWQLPGPSMASACSRKEPSMSVGTKA